MFSYRSSLVSRLIRCFTTSLLLWLLTIYIIRYLLKLLLMYKGWIYEARGPRRSTPFFTKMWGYMVKILSGWNKPMLYSFQGSLPRLPLPSLEETMRRVSIVIFCFSCYPFNFGKIFEHFIDLIKYLRSIRPLVNDENYRRMESLAAEFQSGIGIKLQRYLTLKSWWSSNYVSDWWEEYVYLRGRSPIMVNSNFYGIDAILMHPTKIQEARAASVIYSCLQYRRLIERQELEPVNILIFLQFLRIKEIWE